ncbi:DUF1302 domain-containing protein [Zavarzinia compransoris]|uniref:DUF1302 family protein n=1 Tax=Zavarzinia marina TaxID=2911065 RepID=UPI001F2F1860|nr:DUF1302 family protein [Zavarzinia marina]MCF4165631.1 DUF1302 domain-containing protein [Zavarzinia marina]
MTRKKQGRRGNAVRNVAVVACGGMLSGALAGAVGPALAIDFSISGFIRHEIAIKLSDKENQANNHGNPFNGEEVPLEPVGLDLSTVAGVNNLLSTVGLPALTDLTQPLFGKALTLPPTGFRDVRTADNKFNLMATRVEVNMAAAINANWSARLTVRGYYDWNAYDDNADTDFFETQKRDGGGGTPLEYAQDDYMIDLPVATVDYINGPLFVRAGNQQIAWGEAIFFRVMDVPAGLDYRRHFIFEPAIEEYSDKRVPALGVRASYQISSEWEVEGFIQKFEPTLYPNPSTPYNVVPEQFTVHDRYDGIADDLWNVGGRVRAQLGNLGLQFIAVSRHNPHGVLRWTKSGVNKDLPVLPGSGATMAETPFEVDQENGVKSQEEWYWYSNSVRLHGTQGLNAAIDDFQPATGAVTAYNVGDSDALARGELDTFFWLSGGLRGHIERVYPYENVFGASVNYVFDGEPGSFLEQLIARVEMTYTPDRTFTNPTLGQDFIKEDQWAFAAVFEKWHRWSQEFPAAYLVLQFMYKNGSDIFDVETRHLSGYNSTSTTTPTGVDYSAAVAFAGFQPSPSLEWKFEWAVLYEIDGGFLFQPGIRWKPNDKWEVNLYATVISAPEQGRSALTVVDYADEISMRVTYQF